MRTKDMKETQSNQPVAQVTSTGRGGARAGAGRKKVDPALKKITLGVQVLPATKEMFFKLKRNGVDVNERIEAEINRLAKAFGIE